VNFEFDIQKTIAAVAFLMKKEGGELDMFLALKMLYLADKEALINWGKPITGDSFVSLPKGPALSKVYNLFKGTARRDHQKQWSIFVSEKVNNSIHLLKPVDINILSEREMEILEFSRKKIHEVAPWEVSRWLHESCPEWQDPKGSSIPIHPNTILRNAGKTATEIKTIEESNEAYNFAKTTIGSL
jgi:uncharacterized phage-associated protein